MRHSRKQQPGTTLQLPVMCSLRALSRLSFSRNPLTLHLSLSLHQLNTKPNTIKSHKIQGTTLKQLQHFLSWNKANIKHSCKSQLYTFLSLPIALILSLSPQISSQAQTLAGLSLIFLPFLVSAISPKLTIFEASPLTHVHKAKTLTGRPTR